MATNGTLYMFIHGLAVGHDFKHHLEIVLPSVPGHVYRAGSWLTETDITKNGALVLEGVKDDGNKRLSDCNFIISLAGCGVTKRGRSATLYLPRPKEILELLLTEDPNLVTITHPGLGVTFANGRNHLSQVASILVLVYDYKNENHLYLENHDWEPCSIGGATSLHIISTSLGPEGKDHEVDSEKALRKVLDPYPGLTFPDPPQTRAPNWNETASPLYGDLHGLTAFGEYIVTPGLDFAFAQAELEGIPPRTVRIGRLGRMKQQGRPIETLWQEPDPLSADPCNCGFVRGGRH